MGLRLCDFRRGEQGDRFLLKSTRQAQQPARRVDKRILQSIGWRTLHSLELEGFIRCVDNGFDLFPPIQVSDLGLHRL